MSKGYDNLDVNQQLVLDLPFLDGVTGGTGIVRDQSKNHYGFTMTGPPAHFSLPSGLQVLDFTAATPDFLEAAIADVGDLDFTTEDFSLAFWVNPDTLVGDLELMCHGQDAVSGYDVRCMADGSIVFTSNQGGAQQQIISAAGDLVINIFTLIGFSRSGVLGQLFINGREVAYTLQDDLGNPLTNALKVLFGVYDDETTDPWSQYISRTRAWLNRQLTVDNHRFIFETERHWYGV